MIIHKSIKEWSSLRIIDNKELALIELKKDTKTIKELSDSKIIEINEYKDYCQINTFAYVGRIRLGNLEITINPKIDDLPFLELLDYIFDLDSIRHFRELPHSFGINGFIELLIFELSCEIDYIISRGLFKKYIPVSENLMTIKGRIDYSRWINNYVALSPNIPCRHFNRLEDNILNQTIFAGGVYGRNLSRNISIRNSFVNGLLLMKDVVKKQEINSKLIDNASRNISRLNKNYKKAIEIIKLLYDGSGILFNDKNIDIAIEGFLINMNSFFQKLITKYLTENLIKYKIIPEYKIGNFMYYIPEYNPQNKRNPFPRPDIMVIPPDKPQYYIDTKYIDLWNRTPPSYILYQMGVYSLSMNQKENKVIVLYPTITNVASDAVIKIENPLLTYQKSYIILRPINIMELLDNIKEGNRNKNYQYALNLVSFKSISTK